MPAASGVEFREELHSSERYAVCSTPSRGSGCFCLLSDAYTCAVVQPLPPRALCL